MHFDHSVSELYSLAFGLLVIIFGFNPVFKKKKKLKLIKEIEVVGVFPFFFFFFFFLNWVVRA